MGEYRREDAGLVSNHCRNPGGENPYGAWCFVNIGDWGKARYECEVPLCDVDADQPLLSEACESGSLGFTNPDDEMEALCEHQHCVADRGGDAPCTCLLEQWEYSYGSKARGRSECCSARMSNAMTDFYDVQAASCECRLRSDCEDLNIGEMCLAYSDYCCEDDECRCEFATRACRLALSNGDDDAKELCAKAENSCCTGPFTFLSYADGGCRCDFWEVSWVWIRFVLEISPDTQLIFTQPLCNDNPISATCDEAEATCCNNDGQCSCMFLTYAADELNYVRRDKDVICKLHLFALTCDFVGAAQFVFRYRRQPSSSWPRSGIGSAEGSLQRNGGRILVKQEWVADGQRPLRLVWHQMQRGRICLLC